MAAAAAAALFHTWAARGNGKSWLLAWATVSHCNQPLLSPIITFFSSGLIGQKILSWLSCAFSPMRATAAESP